MDHHPGAPQVGDVLEEEGVGVSWPSPPPPSYGRPSQSPGGGGGWRLLGVYMQPLEVSGGLTVTPQRRRTAEMKPDCPGAPGRQTAPVKQQTERVKHGKVQFPRAAVGRPLCSTDFCVGSLTKAHAGGPHQNLLQSLTKVTAHPLVLACGPPSAANELASANCRLALPEQEPQSAPTQPQQRATIA